MEREAEQGYVCLQGCVIQPGRFGPCCDQHTATHTPKTPVHKGRHNIMKEGGCQYSIVLIVDRKSQTTTSLYLLYLDTTK